MRVLFIEDDIPYIDSILGDVSKEYVVDVAYTGDEGAYLSEVNDYDLIMVSDGLRDCKATDVCSQVRKYCSNVPLLLVSDNLDSNKIFEGIDSGADACIPKTSDAFVVRKGIRTFVRKTKGIGKRCLHAGDLSYNLDTRSVTLKGKEITLRRKEFDILEYLLINKGRVVSKEELLEHIWTAGLYSLSNTVEVHIKHLRDKIEKPDGIKIITTIKGFGYRIQ